MKKMVASLVWIKVCAKTVRLIDDYVINNNERVDKLVRVVTDLWLRKCRTGPRRKEKLIIVCVQEPWCTLHAKLDETRINWLIWLFKVLFYKDAVFSQCNTLLYIYMFFFIFKFVVQLVYRMVKCRPYYCDRLQ